MFVISRRQLLSNSAGAGLIAASAGVLGANERPAYGVIGAGARGRYLSTIFQKLGAQCVALCEVYEPHLELTRKDAPAAKTYVDHQDLLAETGLDFVVIATPDHHHCPHLLDALAAGKDVYLEKPMSNSPEESKKMIEAVRRSGRIVQIGMQRRSAEVIQKAKALVDEGILGRISTVRAMWKWNVSKALDNSPLPGALDWDRFLGAAPKRPLEPRRFRFWRFFWDYAGGAMTDQGTHLMDVAQWFTGATAPRSAVCSGQINKMQEAETPEVFCAVFEYPNHLVTWTLDYCNSYRNGWSIEFDGDGGTLILDETGCRVYREPWAKIPNREPIFELKATVPVEPHVQNFLDCIKSRQQPTCPVEAGASAVCGPQLANVAYREARRVSR